MKNALLLSLLAATASAQTAPRIGAAGAVSGKVTASGGGGAARTLTSGSQVFHKDSVTTDAKGKLQVMLLDQTVFTVGPDSNIVLDEFIYDPFTGAGKVTANVTKGVFRFVTGQVAGKRPADMKIKIPAGTIGIRGTFGAGSVQPNGDTLLGLLGPGPNNNGDERVGGMDIDTGNDTQSLDEPGTGVTVKSDGDVSEPFTLTPEQTESLNAGGSDEGAGGGSGTSSSSSGGGPEEESASESAGEDTALASRSAGVTGDVDDLSSSLDEDTITAAQSPTTGGAFGWEDLRNSLASGSAFYNGVGNYTCSGTEVCSSPGSGTFALHFQVDWGGRTIGGGGSSSHFAFVSGPLLISAEQPGSNIPVTSFASLTGDARLTQGTDYTGSDPNFNGSSFKFTDANTVSGSLQYSNGTDSATGSVTTVCQSGCPP